MKILIYGSRNYITTVNSYLENFYFFPDLSRTWMNFMFKYKWKDKKLWLCQNLISQYKIQRTNSTSCFRIIKNIVMKKTSYLQKKDAQRIEGVT